MVQLSETNDSSAHPTVVKGVELHERVHIRQFELFASNPEIIQGQLAGIAIGAITPGAKEALEHGAYTVEKSFLEKSLKDSTDRVEKKAIHNRLRTVKKQLKRYEL